MESLTDQYERIFNQYAWIKMIRWLNKSNNYDNEHYDKQKHYDNKHYDWIKATQ